MWQTTLANGNASLGLNHTSSPLVGKNSRGKNGGKEGCNLATVKDSGFSPNPYSSHFLLCEYLQSAGVCCDFCDCIFSLECDSVTSALFQRLRYESVSISLF